MDVVIVDRKESFSSALLDTGASMTVASVINPQALVAGLREERTSFAANEVVHKMRLKRYHATSKDRCIQMSFHMPGPTGRDMETVGPIWVGSLCLPVDDRDNFILPEGKNDVAMQRAQRWYIGTDVLFQCSHLIQPDKKSVKGVTWTMTFEDSEIRRPLAYRNTTLAFVWGHLQKIV